MPPVDDGWIQLGIATVAIAVIGLATMLGRSLVARLDGLVTATRRIGRGDYETPVVATTDDELGTLAVEVDAMRVQLRDKLHELQGFNRELERKVTERTAELRRVAEQL